MKEIKTTNSTLIALVDDEDFDRLSKFKWAITGKNHTVVRYKKCFYKSKAIPMSNEIMQDFTSLFDHKDRSALNNQKHNLRECTVSQNLANRVKTANCSSDYKGVSYNTAQRKWKAQAKKDDKLYHGGYFLEEVDAAKAYDTIAKQIHGEFALLNFPEQQTIS